MKKVLKGYILGLLSATLLIGSAAYAAQTVRIVIDGQEIIPTDANGKRVDPIIIDGTTYLPVRAVAEALGQEVNWDGANYTVYIGNANNSRNKSSSTNLENMTNIGRNLPTSKGDELKDNYGNMYINAVHKVDWSNDAIFETLLNGKYKQFTATLYIEEGSISSRSGIISIEADGRTIYNSPEMTKTSKPVDINLDIEGCNDFKIILKENSDMHIGNGVFYQ